MGSDSVANDDFGNSVAISGTTAVVGAWWHAENSGRVYVFSKTRVGWKQTAELKGSDTAAGDEFGSSVAISGTTVVIGAWGHSINAGRAYVFEKSGGAWEQTAELKGSDTVALDDFGGSVATSGTTIVVGADGKDYGAGRAYMFTQTGGVWRQVAELENSDMVIGDLFGDSVAISGRTAIVGAPGKAKQPNYPGRAYVFAS